MTPLNFNMDELNRQVREVLATQEEVHPDELNGVDAILETWYQNKKNFITNSIFNNNLIIDLCPIEVKLSEERKTELAVRFIRLLCDDWEELFPDWSDCVHQAWVLARFLNANMSGFFENKTVEEYEAPDATIISKNVKISKSFKHFFENETLLRLVQDKYSEIVQQDKITGTLCASVHPLDFLSSSENNYGWRSCHALNGDYANGNLSYMMDNCTIIFYIKGADNVQLPRFPESVLWNDKKWRMLGFVSDFENIIWYGRQYPFFSEEMLKKTHRFFETLYSTYYTQPNNLHISSIKDLNNEIELQLSEHILYGDKILPKSELIRNAYMSTHYNDLINSHSYTPYYSTRTTRKNTQGKYPLITIGHTSVCACCGNDTEYIPTSNFVCKDCQKKLHPAYCEHCGKILPDNIAYDYVWGLGHICKECFDNYTDVCPKCGNAYQKGKQCLCDIAFEPIEFEALNIEF